MKYFEKLNAQLRRLGIFYCDDDPKAKKISIATRCGLLIICISYFLAPAHYLLFEAQTPREHLECPYFIISGLFITFWYSVFLYQSEKYVALIDELNSKIQTKIIDPTVNLMYENTNTKIEWMTENMKLTMRIVALVYVSAPTILSIFNYVSTGYSKESFRQSFPASYPFDWRTPLGYTACVFIQLITVVAISEVYVCAIILIIGFCMLIADFASEIKKKLRQFNQILIMSEGQEFSAEDRITLKKKLKDIIEFHSEAREFTNRCSDINSAIVFACPLYSTAIFGSLILQINVLTKTGDIVGIVQILIASMASMFPFFIFCHFGGEMTQQFDDIGNAAYQLEWYRLPLDMQKDLQIVIALAQKRILMRGYGDTCTTHSVFKKILKNKFYYLMVARSI